MEETGKILRMIKMGTKIHEIKIVYIQLEYNWTEKWQTDNFQIL